jgi:hypothetical protein
MLPLQQCLHRQSPQQSNQLHPKQGLLLLLLMQS